jgi:hypothetical protein
LRKAQKPAVAMAIFRGSTNMRCNLKRDHDECREASASDGPWQPAPVPVIAARFILRRSAQIG